METVLLTTYDYFIPIYLKQRVAKLMGLDTSTNANLWKDQALVECNVAVLYSFQVLPLHMFPIFIVDA